MNPLDKDVRTMEGIGASRGQICGPIHRLDRQVPEPDRTARPADVGAEDELDRLQQATAAVVAELEQATATAHGTARDVLAATAQLVEDPALQDAARTEVQQGATAERAVWVAAGAQRDRLIQIGGYLGERAADVDDVRDRLIAALLGVHLTVDLPAHPVVLVADSLSPADTAGLDPARVLAIITARGGAQSHSAILARALAIPAVVGLGSLDALPAAGEVFVDGTAGLVSTDPTPDQRAAAHHWADQQAAAVRFQGPVELTDGHRVRLLANIGSPAEAAAAAAGGAEGIGLLRTEFLFLDRHTEPTVAEQTTVYAEIFAHFPGLPVVVRTLDAGSDKPLPFLATGPEPNPALGLRGFRTHHRTPEVLQRQIGAIAAAASRTEAEVRVMAPMIATAEEAAEFCALVRTAGLTSAGVMIETPAAALCADAVLAPVDFASIGTNDLTQYTMAFDRELPEPGPAGALTTARHPAVLRLIRAVTDAAAAQDPPPPIGVCGEAAADPELATILVGLGVTSLSMSAPALPRVAAALRQVSLIQAGAASDAALGLGPGDAAGGADGPGTSRAGEPGQPGAADGTATDLRATLTITAATGLHARPAALLAKTLKGLDAEVTIDCGDQRAHGASVMEIMALGADPGQVIAVHARGPEAAAAMTAVERAATAG